MFLYKIHFIFLQAPFPVWIRQWESLHLIGVKITNLSRDLKDLLNDEISSFQKQIIFRLKTHLLLCLPLFAGVKNMDTFFFVRHGMTTLNFSKTNAEGAKLDMKSLRLDVF